MSVWDKTTPIGSDPKAQGDDRIRELKEALEDALSTEGEFPGANPSSTPRYVPTFRRGTTSSRPADPATGQIYFNTELKQLEYWSGTAWTAYDLVPNAAITTVKINDAAVTKDKLATDTAGAGLTGGAGSALAVNPDNSTIEVSGDTVQVKAAGITATQLAASVAGNGLAGGAGTPLAVNVDNSSIEINSDSLRVKAAGVANSMLADNAVTPAKIATSVAGNGLAGGNGVALSVNVDGSTLEISSDALRVKDNGIPNAKISDLAISKLTGGPLSTALGGTGLATKILSIVSFTGNGSYPRNIAHSLGAIPDVVLIVGDTNDVWAIRFGVFTYTILSNGNAGASYITGWDATNVTIGNRFNDNGVTYGIIAIKSQ